MCFFKKTNYAEKLHLSLLDTVKQNGIKRVKTDFLSFDLLYFIKSDKWFGFTFHNDPRDNFVQIRIGKLYHVKDVMPRLFITGAYTDYIRKLNLDGVLSSKIPILEPLQNIKEVIKIVEETFKTIIEHIHLEIQDKEKERLQSYLKREIKDINELKQLDTKTIILE
ncbi:MAG: hypothetical protein FWH03_01745 [Firmicutes bacterium]|nr:hypothetical protein [Bacillota bacterium]